MTDNTYNGWPNRETWLTALWLTNEEPVEWTVNTLKAEAQTKYPDDPKLAAAVFADLLLEAFGTPTLSEGLYGDLLGTALARVDWLELATVWSE